jgi:hypothetical protein
VSSKSKPSLVVVFVVLSLNYSMEQVEHRGPEELGHGTAGDASALQGDCQDSPGLTKPGDL